VQKAALAAFAFAACCCRYCYRYFGLSRPNRQAWRLSILSLCVAIFYVIYKLVLQKCK
jgi:hypothetical protein